MNSLGKAIPVVRIHATQEAGECDGAGGAKHIILINCDREFSVFIAGLSLRPRGSCAVSTSAAGMYKYMLR